MKEILYGKERAIPVVDSVDVLVVGADQADWELPSWRHKTVVRLCLQKGSVPWEGWHFMGK